MKHMSALREGGPARNKIDEGNRIRNWNKGLGVEIQEKEKRGRKRIMYGRIRIMRLPQESGSK